MVITDSELADKIVYLKENNYKPNLYKESLKVKNAIESFYFCSKSVTSEDNKLKDSDFWFRLTFCNYQVSDEFVHEINREYKRFHIKNIAKGEF